MRFSAIHKLSSYLMAGFAFAALVLSEELSPWAVLFGGVGIVVSWFWEPPRVRIERWSGVLNAVAVAAFGYTVLSALSSVEWLTPGAHLLVFLLIAKLMSRRSSRDYLWVYLLSFLMLVAGTGLNAEISYAVCFLGYVVTATWALILFHLRREMEENFLLKHSDDSSSERVEVERILNSRRIVGPGFLSATAAVSLGVFFLSLIIFLVFPRVGLGLFLQKSRSRLSFAGFSDGVTLGGHGIIRNDDTVVMRIKVSDPRYQGPLAPELHWRGVAFDRYFHGRWSRSTDAFGTRARRDRREGFTRLSLDPAHRIESLERQALRQEIYLEPLDTFALFAASTPVAFDLDNVFLGSAASAVGRLGQNDEIHYPHQGGLRYVAWADTRPPSPATLQVAPEADKRYHSYLQLPDDLPSRVIDLARSITAGKTTPFEKAEAVASYLRRSYGYTLVMDTEEGREPLDYFLFERKKGHCEYFSSAMAVLLRAVGVPTRNVNGFLGGEWNEYGQYIAVRSGDAHSWVEVWFQNVGWVTYDPTPPAATLARGGDGIMDKLRRLVDNLRLSWFRWVIEYDLGRQVGLLRGVTQALGFGEDGIFRGKRVSRWLGAHKLELAVGLFLLVAAGAAVRMWRARRRSGAAAAPRARRTVDHPVVALYVTASRTLARRGLIRSPSTTPREFAHGLVERAAPGARPYAGLTELYYTARYAQAPIDLEQAQRLVDAVKQQSRAAPRR